MITTKRRAKSRILVDGPAFWTSLERDIAEARESVLIQTLSFEGDVTGHALADALIASNAPVRRVLVDSFNLYFQSDRFVFSPSALRTSSSVRKEVESTRRMIDRLITNGVEVRYTNPVGPLMRRMLARDHKKMAVIDAKIAYLGGINFCEHNFEWHDMMCRMERPDVARSLGTDFNATWENRLAPAVIRCNDIEILNLDGCRNEQTTLRILGAITSARREIHVISPYMTFPFTDALRACVKRGVRVVILTPAENNRGILSTYLRAEAARSGFELRLHHGRMSHLKAMLIDGRRLVLGSSNFDWLTYHLLGEVVAITTNVEMIREFESNVLQPDLAASAPGVYASAWKAAVLDRIIRGVAVIACALCKPRLRARAASGSGVTAGAALRQSPA